MKSVNILNVKVHLLTQSQLLDEVAQRINRQQKTFIATINTEFIVAAQSDAEFKDILDHSDIAIADGVGLLWAANLGAYQAKAPMKVGKTIEIILVSLIFGLFTLFSRNFRQRVIPEQITGVDFSQHIAILAAEKGHSLFLLGEKEGIAKQVSQNLSSQLPALKITGTFAGIGNPEGDTDTRKEVTANPADILLVAYGAPKQEYWIERNFKYIPSLVAIGVGATFLYLSGQVRRAPSLLRRLGLEWLYRLITQPWRWRRQLALPKFILLVVIHKLEIVWH